MSKQDRQGVRTATDLERKYDLASLEVVKKAVRNSVEGLNKTNKTLEEFMTSTLGSIEELREQIDGNITTWFYSGVPTLSNLPASEWTTDVLKNEHLGDLYYDDTTGYAYRFALCEGVYKWIELADNDVAEALALANEAKDTADGKRRVFVTTPTVPYDVGDLWLNNEELYVCNTAKTASESYAVADWEKATKYTDDTSLNNFVDVTFTESMNSLNALIDSKITTWYYSGKPTLSNLPASDWKTDAVKQSHIGDLYYDKDTGYTYRFNATFAWEQIIDKDLTEALALANAASDTADSKRRIFTTTPYPPYDNGDLWFNNGEIYICQISKEYSPNLYKARDWTFANCTLNTDGSATSNFTNHYYSYMRSSLFNDFLMSKKGQKLTFSVADNHDKLIAIVVFGTRANGEAWQDATASGNSVTITVAEDFTEITYIELRWNRSFTASTDTTTITTEFQFEEGNRTEYKPYSGYEDKDFIIATKYTDDTLATQVGDNLEIVRGTVTTIQEGVDAFKIDIETTVKSIDSLQQETIESMERMSYTFGTHDLSIAKSTDPVNTRINNQGLKVFTYNDLQAIFNHRGAGIQKLIVVGDAQLGNISIAKSIDKNGNACTDINYLVSNVQDLSDLEGD